MRHSARRSAIQRSKTVHVAWAMAMVAVLVEVPVPMMPVPASPMMGSPVVPSGSAEFLDRRGTNRLDAERLVSTGSLTESCVPSGRFSSVQVYCNLRPSGKLPLQVSGLVRRNSTVAFPPLTGLELTSKSAFLVQPPVGTVTAMPAGVSSEETSAHVPGEPHPLGNRPLQAASAITQGRMALDGYALPLFYPKLRAAFP